MVSVFMVLIRVPKELEIVLFICFKIIECTGVKTTLWAKEEKMEQEQNTSTQTSGEEKLSFDKILEDKEYQAEFDRRLAKSNEKAIKNSREKWEKEYLQRMEQERSEAEKLAKMDTDQKHQYELKQVQDELERERAKIK